MKLSSNEAYEMINSKRDLLATNYCIDHSIKVGEAASILANHLNLDADKAKTLGYIHDIAKIVIKCENHTTAGYDYLKELGYDSDYYNICLTHSYLNNDYLCTAGGIPEDIPFRTNFIKNHEYTIYEKIINLCDLMCTSEIVTLEKRLVDIMRRRGTYANTDYHIKEAFKLKQYFDDLLGFNLYDLYPSIKDNL